jgi:Putative Actinobacterial Holin-X, holin superfamily III
MPEQNADATAAGDGADAPDGAVGLIDEVVALSRDARDLAHDQLQLVALEGKLAVQSLLLMVGAAIGIALLLVTAWLGLMGALVLWLIGIGLAPGVAMLALAALNLVAVLVPYLLIRRSSRRLGFPATLRSLKTASLRRRDGGGQ